MYGRWTCAVAKYRGRKEGERKGRVKRGVSALEKNVFVLCVCE